MNEKRIELLERAPVTRAIIQMSFPVVMGMLVQILYNLVDTFFIGRLGDPNQIAAASMTTPIFMLLMAIAGIVGTGAASYMSRSMGQKNNERASKTLTIGVAVCVVMSLIVTVLGLLFLTPLVNMMGANEQTFIYTHDYSASLIGGSLFIMASFAVGQLLRAEGAAMLSMIGMFIGTLVNIILDPIFIFTFNMGVAGAGVATVIANGAACLFYFICYARKKTLLHLDWKLLGFDKQILREIFAIGTPASIAQILMSFAMILCNNIAAGYGVVVLAAMGVALKMMSMATFVFMGLSAGIQPLVGYNYGACNFKRVTDVVRTAALMACSIGVVIAVLFGLFATQIISAFANNEQVIQTGAVMMRVLLWSLPFMGGQMICAVTVQAMGKAFWALVICISRQGLMYIPLLFTLNSLFGYQGFLYAQPITDFLMLILSAIILIGLLKTEQKKLDAISKEQRT